VKELINILKALGDENRLHIVMLLLRHDFCVGALSKRLDISEAAVSQHLKVLRNPASSGEKNGVILLITGLKVPLWKNCPVIYLK